MRCVPGLPAPGTLLPKPLSFHNLVDREVIAGHTPAVTSERLAHTGGWRTLKSPE
jgi:hypothetical protein